MTDQVSSPAALVTAKQQAQGLYFQLDQCLETNPLGGANEIALCQMEIFGLHLKWTSSIFAEKVDSLLLWASILYSPRKHLDWNTPYQSGAEAVAHYMRCDLISIKFLLDHMP